MSNPAVIEFEDDGAVYIHWDGDLIPAAWVEFIKDLKEKGAEDRFGDGAYLAARFVVWFTRQHWPEDGYGLGIGIIPPGEDYGQVYTYKVTNDRLVRK